MATIRRWEGESLWSSKNQRESSASQVSCTSTSGMILGKWISEGIKGKREGGEKREGGRGKEREREGKREGEGGVNERVTLHVHVPLVKRCSRSGTMPSHTNATNLDIGLISCLRYQWWLLDVHNWTNNYHQRLIKYSWLLVPDVRGRSPSSLLLCNHSNRTDESAFQASSLTTQSSLPAGRGNSPCLRPFLSKKTTSWRWGFRWEVPTRFPLGLQLSACSRPSTGSPVECRVPSLVHIRSLREPIHIH